MYNQDHFNISSSTKLMINSTKLSGISKPYSWSRCVSGSIAIELTIGFCDVQLFSFNMKRVIVDFIFHPQKNQSGARDARG